MAGSILAGVAYYPALSAQLVRTGSPSFLIFSCAVHSCTSRLTAHERDIGDWQYAEMLPKAQACAVLLAVLGALLSMSIAVLAAYTIAWREESRDYK